MPVLVVAILVVFVLAVIRRLSIRDMSGHIGVLTELIMLINIGVANGVSQMQDDVAPA